MGHLACDGGATNAQRGRLFSSQEGTQACRRHWPCGPSRCWAAVTNYRPPATKAASCSAQSGAQAQLSGKQSGNNSSTRGCVRATESAAAVRWSRCMAPPRAAVPHAAALALCVLLLCAALGQAAAPARVPARARTHGRGSAEREPGALGGSSFRRILSTWPRAVTALVCLVLKRVSKARCPLAQMR